MATRRKPFSEMTPAARLAEAKAAISRIEHEMNTVRAMPAMASMVATVAIASRDGS